MKLAGWLLGALIAVAGALALLRSRDGGRVEAAQGEEASPHSTVIEPAAFLLERPSESSQRIAEPALGAKPKLAPRAVKSTQQPQPQPSEAPPQETPQQAIDRAAAQLEHDKATAARRAERAAKQLDLSPGETLQLADCYLAIALHRRETLAAMRARQDDHEAQKQVVLDLRAWQRDELARQFGAELAQRIEGLDGPLNPGGE